MDAILKPEEGSPEVAEIAATMAATRESPACAAWVDLAEGAAPKGADISGNGMGAARFFMGLFPNMILNTYRIMIRPRSATKTVPIPAARIIQIFSMVGSYQTGMLPCFLDGPLCLFPKSMERAEASRALVWEGSITSST